MKEYEFHVTNNLINKGHNHISNIFKGISFHYQNILLNLQVDITLLQIKYLKYQK